MQVAAMTHVHINGAPSLNLSVRRAQVVPRRRPPHVTLCDGVCVRVVSVAAPYYTAQYSRRAQQQQGAPAHPLSASWAAVGAHPAARRAAQRRRPVPGYDRAVPPRRLKALRAAQHLGPKRRLLAVHAARRAAALPRCRAAALPRCRAAAPGNTLVRTACRSSCAPLAVAHRVQIGRSATPGPSLEC
jgi:hypothetical protein